jgi:hypothetical protein
MKKYCGFLIGVISKGLLPMGKTLKGNVLGLVIVKSAALGPSI